MKKLYFMLSIGFILMALFQYSCSSNDSSTSNEAVSSTDKGKLRGVITDASNGMLLAGVVISFGDLDDVATVESGTYVFEEIERETYTIVARKEGYVDFTGQVEIGRGTTVLNIEMLLISKFRVGPISGPTTEAGGSATFTLGLNSKPAEGMTVTIPVSSSDPTRGTVSPESVLFTEFNWNAEQTLTVYGKDNSFKDGDQTYTVILGPASSEDPNYNSHDPEDVTVINTDNDIARFNVSAISTFTTEAAGTATFSVRLNSIPTDNVTIFMTSSDESEGTVLPPSLTFTPVNWNTIQTVTVTGINDNEADGKQAYKINLGSIVTNDADYAVLTPASVNVINTDDDTPGFTVSAISGNTSEAGAKATFTVVLTSQPATATNVQVKVTSSDVSEGKVLKDGVGVTDLTLTFTAAAWNEPQTVTVLGINDELVDGDQTYSIILDPAVSTDARYNSLNPSDVTVVNQDLSPGFTVSGISGNTAESGIIATFTVRLNTPPRNNVQVFVSSSDTTEGTVSPSSLTFKAEMDDPADWNTARIITVTGVNDAIDDGNQNYTIIFGSAASADSNYQGLSHVGVVVTNVNDDSAGFTLSAISGNTTELGGTATFTVKLKSEPTAMVTLAVSSSDTSEGTVSPSSLFFTSADWNTTQIVTVTGVDDLDVDGNIGYTIVIDADQSTSDFKYNKLKPADVSATNMDND
ncbi:carboxypeptidase regulatory-like domain-containing protein [Deltaproteobacteria bacterium TL4]